MKHFVLALIALISSECRAGYPYYLPNSVPQSDYNYMMWQEMREQARVQQQQQFQREQEELHERQRRAINLMGQSFPGSRSNRFLDDDQDW